MRTDKTASHICYELDHDVQEYAKRLLAKKILHAAQQNNAAPLSDKTAKKTAEYVQDLPPLKQNETEIKLPVHIE